MYQVLAATLYTRNKGYANEELGVIVTMNRPLASISHNYEKRMASDGTWIYRAEVGDVVQFYGYEGPSTGFGGMIISLHMQDGSHEQLIGPWSSRAGVVNQLFPDREPCVECITTNGYVVHIKLNALLNLGLWLTMEDKWDGEIYFRPQPHILMGGQHVS